MFINATGVVSYLTTKVQLSKRKCKFICNFPNESTFDDSQRYKKMAALPDKFCKTANIHKCFLRTLT